MDFFASSSLADDVPSQPAKKLDTNAIIMPNKHVNRIYLALIKECMMRLW